MHRSCIQKCGGGLSCACECSNSNIPQVLLAPTLLSRRWVFTVNAGSAVAYRVVSLPGGQTQAEWEFDTWNKQTKQRYTTNHIFLPVNKRSITELLLTAKSAEMHRALLYSAYPQWRISPSETLWIVWVWGVPAASGSPLRRSACFLFRLYPLQMNLLHHVLYSTISDNHTICHFLTCTVITRCV